MRRSAARLLTILLTFAVLVGLGPTAAEAVDGEEYIYQYPEETNQP